MMAESPDQKLVELGFLTRLCILLLMGIGVQAILLDLIALSQAGEHYVADKGAWTKYFLAALISLVLTPVFGRLRWRIGP